MSGGLVLSDELTLPLEAVTETLVLLGKRGAGKTATASVLVEELLGAGLPVCVLDPLGVWWGLRAAADGQGSGLPVVILGGDHGDLPLPATSGRLIADLVVDDTLSVVLDLSEFSKTQMRRFATDFLERIYRRSRHPLHLVIDEADMLAPQRAAADSARLLGACEDIVRRGRSRGLGCTMLTQRPAVIHKDVLSQAEILIAMRMSSVRDVAAIDDWVRLHAEDDQARTVKASLPSLPIGTAWVWSPGWLQLLQRVKIRPRRTFDSSATPRPGVARPRPAQLADVDLTALKARLTAAEEPEPGPAAGQRGTGPLRQQIAQLTSELAAERSRPPQQIMVPALDPDDLSCLRTAVTALEEVAGKLRASLDRVGQRPQLATTTTRSRATVAVAKPTPQTATDAADQVMLKAGARRMLEVLARIQPLQVTKAQLATLARMKVTGGTFGTYYSLLRRNGFLTEVNGGLLALTDPGRQAVGASLPSTPLDSQAVQDQWRKVLKAGARTMLDALVDAWPDPMTRTELAAAAGLEPSGGTFGTYLGTLRRNGLATIDGEQVRASEILFPTSAS